MKKQMGDIFFCLCGEGEKIKQLLMETWKVSSIMNNKNNFKYIFWDLSSIYMQILSEKVVEKISFPNIGWETEFAVLEDLWFP